MDEDVKKLNGKFQHLVTYCLDLHKEFKESKYRKATITQIEESVSAYDQVEQSTDDPWPGASNITLPLTTISNDNLAPRLVSGLVGKRPYIRFEMESDQDKDDQTEIVETWFDQELEDVVEIENVGMDIAEKVLKEGTVFPMPRYDLDEETKKDFMFVGQELTKEQEAGFIAMEADGKPAGQIGGVYVGYDG